MPLVRRLGYVMALWVVLAGCGDDSGGDELIESLDFLNEGWSASPTAVSMCTNLWSDTEGCLTFAEYLDEQGCPIGVLTWGHLTLSDTNTDLLANDLAREWEDVGTKYACEIDLVEFHIEPG